jgi:hypothetical protein
MKVALLAGLQIFLMFLGPKVLVPRRTIRRETWWWWAKNNKKKKRDLVGNESNANATSTFSNTFTKNAPNVF